MPTSIPPPTALRILIVDDEATIRITLSMCLELEGHCVVSAGTIDAALKETARQAFDLIFLDLRLGLQNGLDFIAPLLSANPWTRIIVITAYASVETAVEAMKRGASDYLPKPFDAAQVVHITRKVAERRQLERRLEALQAALGAMDAETELTAADPAMMSALELGKRVAQSRANLVINGELGTGKGKFAHAIHIWSDRSDQAFATVTCRPDSVDAMERELFDAAGGKVEYCDGGTLVLEEVTELPMRLQPRILRLLKDHEFERGDETTRRKSNTRIIATSSVDLQRAVDNGLFRPDLLLALNVVQIDLPALRDRPADLPILAERYLAFFSKQNNRRILSFTPQALHVLRQHHWPGNVRELRNIIERAVLICKREHIGVEHLPPNLLNGDSNVQIGDLVPLAAVEELHVRKVVGSAKSIRQAAVILGIDAGTVLRRMKRYGTADDPLRSACADLQGTPTKQQAFQARQHAS
jgi:NtrC-family two-component system response regulator AlgB